MNGAHLGFVALLSPQTRAGGVELLGNDTQKLGLVLGSVAVRRADVHHLGRRRGGGKTDVERGGEGREDRRSVSAGYALGRFTAETTTQQEKKTLAVCSDLKPTSTIHLVNSIVSGGTVCYCIVGAIKCKGRHSFIPTKTLQLLRR